MCTVLSVESISTATISPGSWLTIDLRQASNVREEFFVSIMTDTLEFFHMWELSSIAPSGLPWHSFQKTIALLLEPSDEIDLGPLEVPRPYAYWHLCKSQESLIPEPLD